MTPKNSGLAYKLTDEQFTKVIKESTSCIEAMRKMGFKCVAGNARNTVKRRIAELNIDIEHWSDNTKNAHIAIETPHDEYFAKDNPHSGSHIRDRIIKYGLLEYKCALCGNHGE